MRESAASDGDPQESGVGGPSPAAQVVVANLLVDSACADLLSAFEAAGVRTLLLKGPSVARWLYDVPGSRRYVDYDLLLRPGDEDAAARVLDSLGYVATLDDRAMPAWWREHATSWVTGQAGADVDLHRTVPGTRADAATVWSVLSRDTEGLEVGGFKAEVLSVPARALHVVLHAAQHGQHSQALRDLERALERIDDATWRQAGDLARELVATEAFVAGLRLGSRGEAVVRRLGLPVQVSVDVALRAAGARPEALTVEMFARADTLRQRGAIIRHKLLPPAAFMRHWSPGASSGRLGLARAYARRVSWVVRRAAPAVTAWGRARLGARPRRRGARDPG